MEISVSISSYDDNLQFEIVSGLLTEKPLAVTHTDVTGGDSA